jgi:hypothetical protein
VLGDADPVQTSCREGERRARVTLSEQAQGVLARPAVELLLAAQRLTGGTRRQPTGVRGQPVGGHLLAPPQTHRRDHRRRQPSKHVDCQASSIHGWEAEGRLDGALGTGVTVAWAWVRLSRQRENEPGTQRGDHVVFRA